MYTTSLPNVAVTHDGFDMSLWMICDIPNKEERFKYVHDLFMERMKKFGDTTRPYTSSEAEELTYLLSQVILLKHKIGSDDREEYKGE